MTGPYTINVLLADRNSRSKYLTLDAAEAAAEKRIDENYRDGDYVGFVVRDVKSHVVAYGTHISTGGDGS